MIFKEIRVIADKVRNEEDATATTNDWKFAAMVLDRLCLITFTLLTFIATPVYFSILLLPYKEKNLKIK